MSELHASRKMLIDAVAGLSEKQLNWHSAPDRWSIADLAEHLAATETFLFAAFKQVAASPADPAAKAELSDEDFLKSIRNRDKKFKAPAEITPKKAFPDTAAALAAFKERRDNTISYVETTDAQDLRQKLMPNSKIDGYQMLLMLAAHAERHCAQIAEVKASPGYPKR
jgi:uncharacterized damage-inducible protein DinB